MNLLDLLFPKNCLECKKGNKYICDNCLSKVTVLGKLAPYSKTYSIFKYQGVVRRAIIKLKYNFAFDIAQDLANISALEIKVWKLKMKNPVLVPIPLHINRERWRGFNQSEIVGKLIAEKLGWSFKKDLLIRPIPGATQVGLRGSDRVRNICGKFAVNNNKLNKKSTILVFDDVLTTGSTIKEAIKVLKERGFTNVFGLTIAR